MLDTKLLGVRIKELRLARGLTQNAFAEKMHVSFQAVSNWERGIAPPDLENLINIAAFFKVLTDDLLRPVGDALHLGIDGGGTKTEFAVVSSDGSVICKFSKGSSNPNDVGFPEALNVISDGIREAIIKFPSICSLFAGIAGVAVNDLSAKMILQLQEKFPSLKIKVTTDSANLFGADDDAKLAVISGTGSAVFVRRDETIIRVGGWGYVFDTAGSAYDIGRDAVSAALAYQDGMGKATLLTSMLQNKLGTLAVYDSIHKLHEGGKAFIASLAPLVFTAYGEGDEVATKILERNMQRIAELLEFSAKKYGVRKRAVTGGGIFSHHSDIVLPMLRKFTDTELIACPFSPVYGACRQSVRFAGKELSENFAYNFENTYGS